MTAATPGAAWKREDLAIGFVQDRRKLIPMFEEQEELTRLLITRGGRQIHRFCDLGAGDGGLADLVMEAHPGSTCVLVDFSEPMFGAAQERLSGRQGRWELVNADLATSAWLDELPAAGERFDAIVSRLCIHHLPDTRKRELYREAFDLLAARRPVPELGPHGNRRARRGHVRRVLHGANDRGRTGERASSLGEGAPEPLPGLARGGHPARPGDPKRHGCARSASSRWTSTSRRSSWRSSPASSRRRRSSGAGSARSPAASRYSIALTSTPTRSSPSSS